MVGHDLLRYKKKQKFFLFDTETEGLNLRFSRPWQFSYCIFDSYEVFETGDYYLWWDDLDISDGAAIATKFNYTEYKKRAIDPMKALSIIDERLYDESMIPCGHKVLGFDIYIHNCLRRTLNKPSDYSYLYRATPPLDTLILSKAYKASIPPDRQNLLEWQFKMGTMRLPKGVKSTLTAMGKEFKIDFDENTLHNAANDVELNRQVLNNLIYKIEI